MKLKKKDHKLHHIFLFFTSISLLSFLVVSNVKIEDKRKLLKKEIEKLNSELQILKSRNEELKKMISKLQSESYWEEKAREEGYAKEGEEVVIIKRIEEEEKEIQKESIWQKIINLFQK